MTSKKCISAGLKNRAVKVDKVNAQKRTSFMQQPLSNIQCNSVGLGVGLNLNENNNLATSPNNNAFLSSMSSMLPKYGGYDVNAALLAFGGLPNPFMIMDPRQHIHSIQSLLGFTNAPQNVSLDGFLNSARNNKTPSLHSDPEDMIEEVTDDVADEPSKLVMDIDEEDADNKAKIERHSPAISVNSPMSSPRSTHDRCDTIKKEDSARSENGYDNNELACSRCHKTFNHRTELAQHETILCGMIRSEEEAYAAAQAAQAAVESIGLLTSYGATANSLPSHSGSEDERKVRVRTAISEEQQNILKEYYAKNPKPGRDEFRTIAQILRLDSRVVQVWFQNNRSRERKLNNMGYKQQQQQQQQSQQSYTNGHAVPVDNSILLKNEQNIPKIPLPLPQQMINAQVSPAYSRSPVAHMDDQPLDLSIKKDGSTPSNSPRYGTAPLPSDEVINLSRKSLSQYPYVPIGFGQMDRFLNMMPEMARNNVVRASDSVSPASEKQCNHWKDELNFAKETFNGNLSPKQPANNQQQQQPQAPPKRSYVKQQVPEGEGQFICDECDKAFNKQSSLARHKYEHSGEFPWLLLSFSVFFLIAKCFRNFFSQHLN